MGIYIITETDYLCPVDGYKIKFIDETPGHGSWKGYSRYECDRCGIDIKEEQFGDTDIIEGLIQERVAYWKKNLETCKRIFKDSPLNEEKKLEFDALRGKKLSESIHSIKELNPERRYLEARSSHIGTLEILNAYERGRSFD